MYSGIYILKNDNKIVYVGKSECDVLGRVKHHHRTKDKTFNQVTIYKIDNKSDIRIAEIVLIVNLKPEFNKDGISDDIPTLGLNIIGNIERKKEEYSDMSVFDKIDIPKQTSTQNSKNESLSVFD